MKISRKEFLKKLWWILLIPYLALVGLMNRKHHQVRAPKEQRISNVLPEGISFHENIICIKKTGIPKFMEARCTHLGCRIDKVKDGKLVCPCHGSTFDMTGKPIKGPANKSLPTLNFEEDRLNGEYIIILS
jgi:nitrite reductase/ring-hydroxylating ferredoxin subunit